MGNDLHKDPEQITRQKRSLSKHCTPLSVNTYTKEGIFASSKSGSYRTTTESCTCPDFKKRRKPCKHMYRLLNELGIYSLKEVFHDEYQRLLAQKEIKDILPIATQLSLENKKLYRTICYQCGNGNQNISSYPLPKNEARVFIDKKLLEETKDIRRLLPHANYYDIRNSVKELTSEKLPRKKVDLIEFIINNFPGMEVPLADNISYLVLPTEISLLAMTLHRRLNKQIDDEIYKSWYDNYHENVPSYNFQNSSYKEHEYKITVYPNDDEPSGCFSAFIVITIFVFVIFPFIIFVVSHI